MKHMNYNAAENQPHKYARPVTLDEMNRMPGQEEYERRTRTSKVFSLGGGLYQAVMYPEAVHFRDKNSGKLEEIDNTLMPIQDSACGVYLTNRNNDVPHSTCCQCQRAGVCPPCHALCLPRERYRI